LACNTVSSDFNRTYTCSDAAADAATFTTGSLSFNSTQLTVLFKITNSSGTYTIEDRNLTTTRNFGVYPSIVRSVELNLYAAGDVNVAFDFQTFLCTPQNIAVNAREISWSAPVGAPGLTYQVLDGSGKAASGTFNGNTFIVNEACQIAAENLFVHSSLNGTACLVPSTQATVNVTGQITPPTSLLVLSQVATMTANSSQLSFNASWLKPSSTSGCPVTYKGRLSNADTGYEYVTDLVVSESGSTVYLTNLFTVSGISFAKGQFTFTVYAVTSLGSSVSTVAAFFVDPCESLCPPVASNCVSACACAGPANVSFTLSRSHSCTDLGGEVGFFGSWVIFNNGQTELLFSYSNNGGVHYVVNETQTIPKNFTPVSDYLNATNVQFTYTTPVVDSASSVNIGYASMLCRPTIVHSGGNSLTFTWSNPLHAKTGYLDYSVFQDGQEVASKQQALTFTATGKCNQYGNFSVQSYLGFGYGTPCLESSNNLYLPLSFAPQAPTGLNVDSLITSMDATNTHLFLNFSWTPGSDGSCPLTYFATISAGAFSTVVELTNVQLAGGKAYIPSGLTFDGLDLGALTGSSLTVVLNATTQLGFATATSAGVTVPDACDSACPKTFNPAAGCHAKCACTSPSRVGFAFARNWTCGLVNGPAFFWSAVTAANAEAQVYIAYSNGTDVISVVNKKVNNTETFAPLNTTLTSTEYTVSYNVKGNNDTLPNSIGLETHTIACLVPTPILVNATNSLTISWTEPPFADGFLSYTVLENGGVADGTQQGLSFVANPRCNQDATFTVSSYLTVTQTLCPKASAGLTIPLSFLPDPVSNLQLFTTDSSPSSLFLNFSWTLPKSDGYCKIEYYNVEITSTTGFAYSRQFNSSEIAIDGSTVYIPAGVKHSGAVDENAEYTLFVSVVTAKGSSPKVEQNFFLPGQTCYISCPALPRNAWNVNCNCEFNATEHGPLIRDYSYTDLKGAAGFFWGTVTTDKLNGTVSLGYIENSGAVVDILNTITPTVSFEKTDTIKNTFADFNLTYDEGKNESVVFKYSSYAIGCVPSVTFSQSDLSIQITPPVNAGPFLNYQVWANGAPADGTLDPAALKFTFTPRCYNNTVVVRTFLNEYNLTCKADSTPEVVFLSLPATAPSNVQVLSPTVDNTNASSPVVSLNATWNQPTNTYNCTIRSYLINVTNPSGFNFFAYSQPPSDPTAVASLAFSGVINTAVDVNAVFTFTVTAVTDSGYSPSASTTFSFPSSSASSGLSNTVIAGIAVGATVGVVAIALIVYKCMTARKEYEPLAGSSTA